MTQEKKCLGFWDRRVYHECNPVSGEVMYYKVSNWDVFECLPREAVEKALGQDLQGSDYWELNNQERWAYGQGQSDAIKAIKKFLGLSGAKK